LHLLSFAAMFRSLANLKNVASLQYQGKSARSFSSLADAFPLGNVSVHQEPFSAVKTETKLSNGVKVISVNNRSPIATVGVFVNTGSRFETAENYGASFFLKHLAQKSTDKRSALRLTRELELLGASLSAFHGRETAVFSADAPSDKVAELLPILDDILHPRIPEWEVRDEQHLVLEASEKAQQDHKIVTFDLLHQEAYRNRSLGVSLYPSATHIKKLNDESLLEFVEKHYGANNVAVVGVGAFDHASFGSWAEEAFGYEKRVHVKKNDAKYFGGDVRVSTDADGNTYLAVAFEGASLNSKDLPAINVLQQLLGNGKNTGKHPSVGSGVTGRLNRNIREKSGGKVSEISAFNINYSDSGLFGVFGIVHGQHVPSYLHSIATEFGKAHSVSGSELEAAKKRAKSSFIFTDSRKGLSEYYGHQALSSDKSSTVQDFANSIDSVTEADVKRVASKVFASKPTLVAVGGVEEVPTIEEFQAALRK